MGPLFPHCHARRRLQKEALAGGALVGPHSVGEGLQYLARECSVCMTNENGNENRSTDKIQRKWCIDETEVDEAQSGEDERRSVTRICIGSAA